MPLHNNKVLTGCGMLIACGILLGYLEFLIPLPIGIPGVKLGLSNIITLITLELFGPLAAFVVLMARVILSGLLFGNMFGLLYGLSGAVFAYLMMILAHRLDIFSCTGISIIGGVFHNIGQLIIACFVVSQIRILYYIPVLLASGLICGTLVGLLATILIKRLSGIRGEQ